MTSTIVNQNINNDGEEELERSLRPSNFSEIIGRALEKESLTLMIDSAKKRKKALDHILFHGPPGLGKTSFAYVIAKEMGVPIYTTNGSLIQKAGDLAAILTGLEPYSILFIDEIHRLRQNLEEILYPAMEDKVLDIIIGKGPSAKTVRIDLPEFTLVGATTKLAMLSSPLRDRFGMTYRLDFHTDEEMNELVKQKADMLNISIDDKASWEIATRARMTGRIAIRILKRVRDMAIVNDIDLIDFDLAVRTLELLEIDTLGLDKTDRRIIESLITNFDLKPVGLNTLAIAISEEPDTLENVYEPFLIKKGLLKRTPKGRVVTDKAIKSYSNLKVS